VRILADLIRSCLLAVAILLVPGSQGALAAGPGTAPGETPRPPTCAERFPAEGPAGVDLRLGCIVSEVIGLWRPGEATPPPTLSTYAIVVGILGLALVALGLLGVRLFARRAGARLAPTTPDAWWVCPTCRSINGTAATRCYNCSTPQPDAGAVAMLETSPDPGTPQSFGRRKHE
jgi:hypothetical protein